MMLGSLAAILCSSSVIVPKPVIWSSQRGIAALSHPAMSSLTPFDSTCVPEKTTQFLFFAFMSSLVFKTSSPTTPRKRSLGMCTGNCTSRCGETAIHPETLLKILLYAERWHLDTHPSSPAAPEPLTNTASEYCIVTR